MRLLHFSQAFFVVDCGEILCMIFFRGSARQRHFLCGKLGKSPVSFRFVGVQAKEIFTS